MVPFTQSETQIAVPIVFFHLDPIYPLGMCSDDISHKKILLLLFESSEMILLFILFCEVNEES